MKKLILMSMAATAMFFMSCGSKNAQQAEAAEETDSTEAVVIEDATAELAAQLEAGDANKFQEALTAAQAKAAELLEENPEAAKTYLENVQNYLKENTEKIKAMAGDNVLVSTAVNTFVETPAESIITNLQTQLGNAEDAANAKAQETKDAAQSKVDEAKQAVENQANTAKAAAEQKANEAKQAAASKVNEAASKANQEINKGADKLLKGAGLK